MVESWAAERHVDKQSGIYIKDPDTPVQIRSVGNSKGRERGKQWVGMASVAFANSISCLRVECVTYLGDNSGDLSENFQSLIKIFDHSTDNVRFFDKMVL